MLATAMAVMSWYFGFSELDIGPVVWALAALALMQFALSAQTRSANGAGVQRAALASQILGTAMMGVAWHEFGGLQQPIFPLFALLPLLSATLLLDFWRLQLAVASLLLLLTSGVLLSPETNSFMQERYGLGPASMHVPSWLPRSRIAFADVSTSPTYDLVMMSSLAVMTIAIGATGRAMTGLCSRELGRLVTLEDELVRVRRTSQELISRSPRCEALVSSSTGRLILSSEYFQDRYAPGQRGDLFFLDAIEFRFPAVVKQLLVLGGEDVQAAKVGGRDMTLRLSAVVMGAGISQSTRVIVEDAEDLSWRAVLDGLQQPAFTIDPRGRVGLVNRSARAIFGTHAEGSAAEQLFDGPSRWWEIAPLESARQLLDRGERQFVASIRRERVAESVGDLICVYLHERASLHALSA